MARIAIDLARRIGTVDRRIFGNFIEHLGRCIYGGVFDEGSPLSDARGFRRDVLDAVRPLRIPVLRWPGGNFVSGYHWLDGVGPAAERPRRSELAWYAEESNRFGTNEFLEYCRVLDTEPYICVNMGSGTMDEAQAWVEYCNGTGNTHWANLRRAHGHPEPYRVRYWGLGNEMYGSWQIGHLSPEDYVKKARAFALVMKRTDPDIELDRLRPQRLERLGPDRHRRAGADHRLVQHPPLHGPGGPLHDRLPVAPGRAGHPHLRGADRARPLHAAVSRIRSTSRSTSGTSGTGRGPTRTGRAASRSATASATRWRWPRISTASSATARSSGWRTSPSSSTRSRRSSRAAPACSSRRSTTRSASTPSTCGRWRSTSTSTRRPTTLPPGLEERTHGRVHRVADLGPFPLLDAVATCDDGGRELTIGVVNRDRDRAHRATIDLGGATATGELLVSEVNGPDVDATNSFEHPDRVGVREHRRAASGHRLEHEFPAHSVSVLRVRLGP